MFPSTVNSALRIIKKEDEREGKLGSQTLDDLQEWFAGTAYGKRWISGQEKSRIIDQNLIDQGGLYGWYLEKQQNPNSLEQKILKNISDLTNIDQRISTPLTYLGISMGATGLSNVKIPKSALTKSYNVGSSLKKNLKNLKTDITNVGQPARLQTLEATISPITDSTANQLRQLKALYKHHEGTSLQHAAGIAKLPSWENRSIYIPPEERIGTQKGEPLMTTTGGQGELFTGPIDPEGKEAFRIYNESLAKRSGYDTFKMMKKEIFNKWPRKDQDQAFRQLWQGTQTGYIGYAEHLTAKASKKLRRQKIVKKNPNLHYKQIDKILAEKSRNTFDLDWLWDKDWIDEKGIRRTDGLNRGDRNAPENMSLLFNDRLKSVKDQLENVGYGSEERVGILWGDPATNTFRDPDKRFLIKFEDPSKRSVKKPYLRQNPGHAIIYRASNGKIIGKLGQYLDVLYPKNIKHPATGKIINTPLDIMKQGVAQTINPDTGKLFTDIEEFREFIINERFKLILDGTTTLPSNITARNRHIDKFVNQDMVELREKYPWLPDVPVITKQIAEDPGMSVEGLDKRTQTRKGPFPTKTDELNIQKAKRRRYVQKELLDEILGPDNIRE